jgi:Rap guanine nucleotide exchange factor 1
VYFICFRIFPNRLQWAKKIIDSLEEYAKLFDSSKSFGNYRRALIAAQPPCIPYIGMILSDLTFVHLGNDDLMPDNSINFEKRWLQYDNVLNMKRFRYQ